MGLKEKLSAVFILTRPYSHPGVFLLYYVAKVIVTKSLELGIRSTFAFFPVYLAWIYMTLVLEAEHRHSNREKIPYSYPTVILAITVVLAITFGGFTSIMPFIFFIVFTYMYIKKNSIPILGSISFISRGFIEASLFFSALAVLSVTYLQTSTALFGIVILLTTSARNLLGDIRDTKFDEITFTARFGDKSGYTVSILLYTISAYILFSISQNTLGVVFPIILMIILLAIIDNGYLLHRLSVLLSAITMAAYILFLTGNNNLLILLNAIFLSITGSLVFYNLVPRRSNPYDDTTVFGFAPWSKSSNLNKKTKHLRNSSNRRLGKRAGLNI